LFLISSLNLFYIYFAEARAQKEKDLICLIEFTVLHLTDNNRSKRSLHQHPKQSKDETGDFQKTEALSDATTNILGFSGSVNIFSS